MGRIQIAFISLRWFLQRLNPRLKCISNRTVYSVHQPRWCYFSGSKVLSARYRKQSPLGNVLVSTTSQAQLDHLRLQRLEPTTPCHSARGEGFPRVPFLVRKKSPFISDFNLPHYVFTDIAGQLKQCCKWKLLVPRCKFYCHDRILKKHY